MSDRPNFAGIVIGAPESGKSTVLRMWAKQFLTNYSTGIAIVHDTQAQFGDLGTSYQSADEYREAMRRAARDRVEVERLAAIWGFDSDPVAQLAYNLCELHNHRRPTVRVPVLLEWDETSVLAKTSASYVARMDKEMITTRRHLGLQLAYNMQNSSGLPSWMFEIVTDVVIFRLSSDSSARDLEEKLAIPKRRLDWLIDSRPERVCDPFRYAHWRRGAGFV